jgi:hypothetical protein
LLPLKGDTNVAETLYRCAVIEESLGSPRTLAKLLPRLVRLRVEAMPNETPSVWRVNEYLIPHDDLIDVLPWLEADIKEGWYAHAFNIEKDVLYVVLHGRSFKLPTIRDSRWDTMIEYGKTVGCDPKWTENVPLRV